MYTDETSVDDRCNDVTQPDSLRTCSTPSSSPASAACDDSVTSKDSDIGSLSTENDAHECGKSVRSDGSVCSSGFQEKKRHSLEGTAQIYRPYVPPTCTANMYRP